MFMIVPSKWEPRKAFDIFDFVQLNKLDFLNFGS